MVEKMKVNRFWKNICHFHMKNTTKFCQISLFFSKKITIFFDKFSDIFPKSIYFCFKMVEKMKVTMNLSFPHEKHYFFCQIYLFFPKKIAIFFDKFNDIFPKSIYFCLKMVKKMKVIMNLSFPHEKHNKILSNFPFFLQKITIFFDKFSDIFPKSIYFCLKMVEKMKVTMNLSFPHEKH